MINQAPTPMQLGLDTVHALGFVEALGVIGFSLVYVQTLVDEINAASEARLAVFKAREAARTH